MQHFSGVYTIQAETGGLLVIGGVPSNMRYKTFSVYKVCPLSPILQVVGRYGGMGWFWR